MFNPLLLFFLAYGVWIILCCLVPSKPGDEVFADDQKVRDYQTWLKAYEEEEAKNPKPETKESEFMYEQDWLSRLASAINL